MIVILRSSSTGFPFNDPKFRLFCVITCVSIVRSIIRLLFLLIVDKVIISWGVQYNHIRWHWVIITADDPLSTLVCRIRRRSRWRRRRRCILEFMQLLLWLLVLLLWLLRRRCHWSHCFVSFPIVARMTSIEIGWISKQYLLRHTLIGRCYKNLIHLQLWLILLLECQRHRWDWLFFQICWLRRVHLSIRRWDNRIQLLLGFFT